MNKPLLDAADRLVGLWYQYAILSTPSIRDAVSVDEAATKLRELVDDERDAWKPIHG